jgi:orotidine-5'-phosphate decarboxylase
MMPTLTAKDRIVLALDIDNDIEALGIVAELRDVVGIFKVGHQLFTAYGPDIVRRIINTGGRVFLDLKYHDIPNTVAKASAEAVKLGVSIFNVHALGEFREKGNRGCRRASRRLPVASVHRYTRRGSNHGFPAG